MATLYYDNATTDSDWNTLGNWWTDAIFETQATSLPTSIDSVELYATVTLNGGSEPTVVNCSTTSSISINITVTTMATFNGSSSNVATLTGNATFNDTSYNNGTVSGNATWSASAFTNFSGGFGVCCLGTVSGTITFSSATAVVFTTDMGNSWTYDSSSWTFTAAGPTWIFDGGGTNNTGTLYGDATFNAGSYNSGTIYGDVTFNSTSSNGAGGETYGDAVFNDSSSNAGTVNNNPTVLLLHFNGSDGSTTFTDSSPNELTATANDSVQISTAQSVFGGASALFDGTGDYIEISDSSLDLGAGDFCVEGWIRFNAITDGVALVSKGANGTGGWSLYYYQSTLYLGVPYVSNLVQGAWSAATGVWYHLACTRQGTDLRLFLDGALLDTQTNSDNLTSATPCRIGKSHSDDFLNGYVDEVRVVKGFAVYTSSFTPPTSQLGLYP